MDSDNLVKCLVCGNLTKRLHFRVASCRACAVFFRRSINLKKEYLCELESKKCDLLVADSSKALCRYCRFERCKSIGMKFEADEKESKQRKDESCQTQLPTSFNWAGIKTSLNSSSTATVIADMKPLVENVKEIFSSNNSIVHDHSTSFMKEISTTFTEFLNELKPKDTSVKTEFDRELLIQFTSKYWVELAKLLISSNNFNRLEYLDKILLFDHLKGIFLEITCSYLSILLFGYDLNETRVVNDNGTIFIQGGLKGLTIKGARTDGIEKYAHIWKPITERKQRYILAPMKSMRITKFEMIYLLSVILWDVQDINGLSSEAVSLAEKHLRQAGDELHKFYVNDMGIENYASRMGTLHRIVYAGIRFHQENQEMYTMAKVFNMFEMDIINDNLLE